ncbi:hypothetical protein J2Z79_002537 [Symbiobacterium terraclitae]|uniref:Uncharacterized protein n=1 Tax=Symbiobacterium terraclitae TaxID=557451 RepID=A0ABS4JUC8_9FIRM|nr:hypothetical protein [Symbiobacterium terraclitae]MBP2019120.1 hypothetical protein [Symbiobacterium terraclitae]
MTKDPTPLVRGAAVLLMTLVTVFHIIGGIGAVCVSFGGPDYRPAVPYIPYHHIYQPITIAVMILGFVFVILTYAMFRGERWAVWTAIGLMAFSLVITYIRMQYALMIRGGTAPTNVRFYITVVTFLYMLVTQVPTIRRRVDWRRPLGRTGSYSTPGGVALMVAGLFTALSPWGVGASHVIDGVNYALIMLKPLLALGGTLMLIGAGLLLSVWLGRPVDQVLVDWVRRRTVARRPELATEGGRR